MGQWPRIHYVSSCVANYDTERVPMVGLVFVLTLSIFKLPRFSISAAPLTVDAAGPFPEPCDQYEASVRVWQRSVNPAAPIGPPH